MPELCQLLRLRPVRRLERKLDGGRRDNAVTVCARRIRHGGRRDNAVWVRC